MDKLPRFWFGQLVESAWFSEERDRTMTDKGVIVGIACKLPEFLLEGWCYAIEYTALDNSIWIPVGHVDWVHESELRLVEQPRSSVNPVR